LQSGDLQQGDDPLPVDLDRDFAIAFGDASSQFGEKQQAAGSDELVVLSVLEAERQNAKIAQIGFVNTGKALGQLGANPQKTGREGGMFAARSLPVIVAPNDSHRPVASTFAGEIRSKPGIDELTQGLNVGA